MRRWYMVTRPDYPIWTVATRIFGKESLPDGRTRWLVQAPDYVRYLSRRAVEVSPVVADTASEERAA